MIPVPRCYRLIAFLSVSLQSLALLANRLC